MQETQLCNSRLQPLPSASCTTLQQPTAPCKIQRSQLYMQRACSLPINAVHRDELKGREKSAKENRGFFGRKNEKTEGVLDRFLASKASKKNVTKDPIFVFNNQLPLPRSAIPLSLGTFLPSSLSLLRYSLPNHPTPLYSSPQASPIHQKLIPTLRRRNTPLGSSSSARPTALRAPSGHHRPPLTAKQSPGQPPRPQLSYHTLR